MWKKTFSNIQLCNFYVVRPTYCLPHWHWIRYIKYAVQHIRYYCLMSNISPDVVEVKDTALWAISLQHRHLACSQWNMPFTLSLWVEILCCISLLGAKKDFKVGGLLYITHGFFSKQDLKCGTLCRMYHYFLKVFCIVICDLLYVVINLAQKFCRFILFFFFIHETVILI